MPHEFNKALESFKKDFNKIKGKEFRSNRKHNTGIGKTFEDLIGVEENNNLLIDYQNQIELKSQRQFTGSMLTLFTKSPSPQGVNTFLKDNFGSPDEKFPEYNILHTTMNAVSFNTYKGKYGFKIELNDDEEKAIILVKDLESNRIVNDEAYYDYCILKNIVETKCKNIAYISAKNRKHDGHEYFIFDKATMLSGLTYEKFMTLLREGIIKFDIRIGIYRSGKNLGKPHDHGSAFRISKQDLHKAFDMEVLD